MIDIEMEKLTQVNEAIYSDDKPTIDAEYIHNLLILGYRSKNAWNPQVNPNGPKRNYERIIATESEYNKFDAVPSYVLHEAQLNRPRTNEDLIGTFYNPRPSDKGLRADLKYIKGNKQVEALIDNIQHDRPFGGFSPTFDFEGNPMTGAIETVHAVESIDFVPTPGTVKSAMESEEHVRYTLFHEHESLMKAHEELYEAHKALEAKVCAMESHEPSDDIDPEKAKTILKDDEVNGHPLTDDQKKMFGAAAGRAEESLYNNQEQSIKTIPPPDVKAMVKLDLFNFIRS